MPSAPAERVPGSVEPIVTTTVKRAGGSLIVTVPAAARDALRLAEGQKMRVLVEGDRLVLERAKSHRPVYTLEELVAQCDFDQPYSEQERVWLDASPEGREDL